MSKGNFVNSIFKILFDVTFKNHPHLKKSTTVFQFKILHEGEGIIQANPPNFFRSCGEQQKKRDNFHFRLPHMQVRLFFSAFFYCANQRFLAIIIKYNHKIAQCTLGGFNQTILDPSRFQNGLIFKNQTGENRQKTIKVDRTTYSKLSIKHPFLLSDLF